MAHSNENAMNETLDLKLDLVAECDADGYFFFGGKGSVGG